MSCLFCHTEQRYVIFYACRVDSILLWVEAPCK